MLSVTKVYYIDNMLRVARPRVDSEGDDVNIAAREVLIGDIREDVLKISTKL